jgi:hypothetical protein
MRFSHFILLLVCALAVAIAAAREPPVVTAGAPPTLVAADVATETAAFRSRLGFGGFRSGGYSSRHRYGYGYRRPSLLHRAVKTAIWLYVLHLFFTHGGLSILLWIIVIALVAAVSRRRTRRTARFL